MRAFFAGILLVFVILLISGLSLVYFAAESAITWTEGKFVKYFYANFSKKSIKDTVQKKENNLFPGLTFNLDGSSIWHPKDSQGVSVAARIKHIESLSGSYKDRKNELDWLVRNGFMTYRDEKHHYNEKYRGPFINSLGQPVYASYASDGDVTFVSDINTIDTWRNYYLSETGKKFLDDNINRLKFTYEVSDVKMGEYDEKSNKLPVDYTVKVNSIPSVFIGAPCGALTLCGKYKNLTERVQHIELRWDRNNWVWW